MKYERNFNLINRKFRELLIPTMAISIAGNFAILADALLVSFILGSEYLAVIQTIEPLTLFLCVVYWMIGLGGSILCSIAKADFDDEKANTIFTVALLSNIIIGVLFMISCFIFGDAYTEILCQFAALQSLVKQYLLLYAIGMPFLCYVACMAYFIKSYGFLKLQFWTFLIANVINVSCDVIFMKYLNLGVGGAGLASSVGFGIGTIVITSYFFSSRKSIKIIKVKASTFLRYLGTICKSGYSSSARFLYDGIRGVLINYLLTALVGVIGLEAFNMCNNVLFIVMIFILGTIQSIVPIVSVYYKEEDYRGVAYVCDRSMKLAIGFGLFFMMLFIAFPHIALYLFNVHDPDRIPFVINAVQMFSLCFVGYAVTNLYVYYAQSTQKIKLSNAIALLEGLVFPLILIYVFSYFLGVNGIWIGFAVTEILTILTIFIYTRHVSKKTNGETSGFFLLKQSDDKNLFEYTFNGSAEEVESLSNDMKKTIPHSKLSEIVISAIEEMLLNIIRINGEVDLVDIIVRKKKDSIKIGIKYSGIVFNPLEDENSDTYELNKYVDNIEYSQILEINNIEISINNDAINIENA